MTDVLISNCIEKVNYLAEHNESAPDIPSNQWNSINIYLCPKDMKFKTVTRTEMGRMMREFNNNLTHYLMTTRFSDETFAENRRFCDKHPTINCIYGSPVEISATIPKERLMFVLEMNNETDTVEGIGMVRNKPNFKKHVVYSNNNYNRYTYFGKYRIARSEMKETELKILKMLESFCFRGFLHMKRGHGITAYSLQLLFHMSSVIDVIGFLKEMFKERIREKEEEPSDKK